MLNWCSRDLVFFLQIQLFNTIKPATEVFFFAMGRRHICSPVFVSPFPFAVITHTLELGISLNLLSAPVVASLLLLRSSYRLYLTKAFFSLSITYRTVLAVFSSQPEDTELALIPDAHLLQLCVS